MNWMRANEPPSTLGGRLDRQRLREPGHALDQQVPLREQADEHALEHRVLPGDHAPDLEERLLEALLRLLRRGRVDGCSVTRRSFFVADPRRKAWAAERTLRDASESGHLFGQLARWSRSFGGRTTE